VGEHRQLARLFANGALAPAKSLTALPGIRHMKGKNAITWVHFACDRYEVVIANGCLSESLPLGPMVVNRMSQGVRRSVIEIFGPPPTPFEALNGPPARVCLTVRFVRRLLAKTRSGKSEHQTKNIRRSDACLISEPYKGAQLAAINVERELAYDMPATDSIGA